MNPDQGAGVNQEQATAFLNKYYKGAVTDIALVGEGAWSRCFGFQQDGADLVIRFGNYVDDFQTDDVAQQYATPALPIPAVLDIGQAFDGYYAISTRAWGVPLEDVGADQWRALVPAVAAALEAMRLTDLAGTAGFGGWDATGTASHATWAEHLLTVGDDTPDRRTYGWRQKLATCPEGDETFAWGFDLLQQMVVEEVPRSLLHCDLINRNVLVQGDRIDGIFDWGCSRYGDHLYELAWFEFWSSWYPQQDVTQLRRALEARWRATGYWPENYAARLRACHLHIGLDHLAYNAYVDNQAALLATAARTRTLATLP